MIGLIDLYCLYNRARGTNLISPDDLNVGCAALDGFSKKYMMKTYSGSNIKTIQLRSFNETAYFEKLAKILEDTPGLTVDKLASKLKINVSVMREQI